MEKEETNGAPSNAMWGNTSWGMTPWMQQQKQGASGMDISALVLGIVGTGLGLMSGGLGLFNQNRGPNGGNGGGPNLQDRIAALEASVAVNSQRDIDLQEQTKLQIENAKQAAEIEVLKAKSELTALITAVNNQVIVNAGTLNCVKGKVDDLTQIGIPAANIINPATTTVAGASSAG